MNLRTLLADLLGRLQAGGEGSLLIGYDEAQSWPNATLAVLTEAGLVTPASLANTLICDECEEACAMPVRAIPGSHPRAFILCDKRDDTGPIPVALARLQQWQISESAMIRVLVGAIDGFPVTEQQIREFLPTLPLQEILSFEHGQLEVDGGILLKHLRPDAEAPEPNRIGLAGDHWSVTYQGQKATFNNRVGIRYVTYLIRNQGKKVSVADLYYAINPPDNEATDPIHSAMTANELGEMGLSVGDLGDAGDALTPEGKRRLQQALQEIQERIDEATERGDEERQAALEAEQEEILGHIAAESGMGGRSRKASSTIERQRKSVTKRIRHDIRKITQSFPDLGHHLDETIRTGTQCQYAPNPPVQWLLEPK